MSYIKIKKISGSNINFKNGTSHDPNQCFKINLYKKSNFIFLCYKIFVILKIVIYNISSTIFKKFKTE